MKSYTAKILAGVVGLVMVLSFVVATPAQALTSAEIAAQIAALQAQLNALNGGTTTTVPAYTFTRTLKVGSTGADVMNLQKVLNMSADTQVAISGAGSPGHETSTFGPATKAAVIKFQNKYAATILAPVGLTSGTGLVGPATIAKLNNMGAVVSTPGTNPGTTGPVNVTLGTSASYGALVSPSATAVLATFNFQGNGTVTNVTLNRNGVSTDSTLSNVYLYSGAVRLTDQASVVNGVITFNNPNGLFSVQGSMPVTVRGDIASGHGGETVGVTLASYTVMGGSAVTANLMGNIQNVASNTNAATVSIGTQTVSSASVNAGTNNYTVWGAPVTVSTRAVNLQGVTFKYIGSAPTSALSNVQLYVDGSAVGAPAVINSNTQYVSFDLTSAPVMLQTGSHTVEVHANIVGGANRNFMFSLQNAGDFMAADSQLQGVNVSPVSNGSSTTFTTVNGGTITINNGTISVQTDPAFNTTTTITGGATQVPLAQFLLTAYGEDVKITTLTIDPQVSGQHASMNNVALFANGAQIGSSQNDASSTSLTYNLGSSLIVPAGQTVKLTVKGDTIRNSDNGNITTGTITVTLKTGSSNGQGVSSSQLVNVPSSDITSNSLSVGSGSPTVAANTALLAQTIAPNSSNVKIGSFVVQASSAEGLRVTNVTISLGGSLGASTSTGNLKIVANGVTANPIAPSINNNFPVNYTIPTSGTSVIDVYADITTSNSGTIIPSITVNGQGAVSNSSVSGTATGATMTVGTGSVATPTLRSTSPSSQFVVGGQSFNLGTFNFVSTTTPATIQELKFTVTGTNSVNTVTVAGVSAPVVSGVADIAGLNITIPAGNAGVDVPVTVAYNTVGNGGVSSGTISTTSLTYMKTTVGNTTTASSTLVNANGVAARAMTLVASKPTVTVNGGSTTGLGNTETELIDVTVQADANGPINLDTLPISVTLSGAGVISSQTLIVRDAGNNNISNVSGTLAVGTSTTGTATITFSGGYNIGAGQSQTFRIYATPSSVSGNAGTQSVSTKLGSSASFTWTDVLGGSSEGGLTGALIQNYPTASHAVTN